jgi:hypothetical protein
LIASVVLAKGNEGGAAMRQLDELVKGLADQSEKNNQVRNSFLSEIIELVKKGWLKEEFTSDREYFKQLYLKHHGVLKDYLSIKTWRKDMESINNRTIAEVEMHALNRKAVRKANTFYNNVAKSILGDEFMEIEEEDDVKVDVEKVPEQPQNIVYFVYMLKCAIALYLYGLLIKVGCGRIDKSRQSKKDSESTYSFMELYMYKAWSRSGGCYDPVGVALPPNPDLSYRHAELLIHLSLQDIRAKLSTGDDSFALPGKSKEFYDGQMNKVDKSKRKAHEKKNLEWINSTLTSIAEDFGDTAVFVKRFQKVCDNDIFLFYMFVLYYFFHACITF